jgi:proteasome lid subunit RPN8/RPN11
LSTSFRLLLPRHFYNAMLAQAKAELPNECCGLLAGRIEKAEFTVRVADRYPLINAAASPVTYLSEDRSLLEAHKDMRRRGLEEVAVYHSHPTSAPIPSRKDREQNFYGPEIIHFIISLQGPEPVMKGWRLTAEDYQEADWELTD